MQHIVSSLSHWQELIGAFIGGLLGLGAALIVAQKSKSEEQRACAMLVLSDLIGFESTVLGVKEMHEAGSNFGLATESDRIRDFVDKFILMKIQPSPIFEPSMMRLLTINNNLSLHLTSFAHLLRNIEILSARIIENTVIAGKPLGMFAQNDLNSDIAILYTKLTQAKRQAHLAIYLIDKMVLGKYPLIFRFRFKFLRPNEYKNKFNAIAKPE